MKVLFYAVSENILLLLTTQLARSATFLTFQSIPMIKSTCSVGQVLMNMFVATLHCFSFTYFSLTILNYSIESGQNTHRRTRTEIV